MMPKPPTWNRVRITPSPKPLQYVPVSTTTRPVTQTAEVEVKSAVTKSAEEPFSLATGSISRTVPSRITVPKAVTTVRAGCAVNSACHLRAALEGRAAPVGRATARPVTLALLHLSYPAKTSSRVRQVGAKIPAAHPNRTRERETPCAPSHGCGGAAVTSSLWPAHRGGPAAGRGPSEA